MIRKTLSSLRFRLILIGILALLPSLALVLLISAQLHEHAAEDAKDDALRLVNLAASNQDALIDGARQTLITLARVPVVRDTQSGNCDAFLAELLTHYSSYSNFVVALPNGDVVCGGLPRPQPVNLADRPYFQRVLQTGDFAVSEYLIARGLGKAIITLAYPVLDDGHQLKGILVVGLDLEWMNQLAERAELPPGSALTVIDRNGTILTRYPEHEKYVGKMFAEAPIVKTILESKTEGTTQALGIDGIDRLYVYSPLGNASEPVAFIFISTPSALIFADADRATNTILIGLIVMIALALTATWIGSEVFLLRRVNALVNATQRLAAGDLSARTDMRGGMSELSQLARAFDGMADSLQQREREREQAEEALAHSEKEFRTLAENALIGIFRTTVKGEIQYVNNSLAQMLGFDSPQDIMRETSIVRYKNPTDRTAMLETLQKEGKVNNLNIELLNKVGKTLNFLLSATKEGDVITGMIMDITERKRAEERILIQLHRLAALRKIDQAIADSMDISLVLNVVLDQAISQLGMDAAVILLCDPEAQVLKYANGRGFRTEALQRTHLPLGEGYAGRVALGRQIVHISELQTRRTDFLRSPTFSQEGFVSYFGVPLIAKGEIKGVLEIFHRTPFEAETEWLNFLEMLAGQAAIAIDNATLFKGLQLSNIELAMAYDATIEGWSQAMDLRDKETEGHTQRVAKLTLQLARAMGMSEEQIIHVRRGALLHDMGKLGVPDEILFKLGKLTDEEWVIMRQHPQFAFDMLSSIEYIRPALDIPYCHHEKWDGSGYPRGLRGEQIPLAARIFAVVDVYDALTSDRPYRAAWSKEKTLEHIRSLSGTHFEPKAVELFFKMNENEKEEG